MVRRTTATAALKPARRSLDLVVFGASSFVGRILCEYLYERFGAGAARGRQRERLRWALAGRSEARLREVRAALGAGAARLPLIVADAGDAAALRALCLRTRVVISTVGPYALHGEPIVAACAGTGTHYADLTGEVQWIRRMLIRHEHAARESGARLVHCCGFDSIPSDLGVQHLQREARRRFGEPCTTVSMRLVRASGGVSGGTAASLLNLLKEASSDPQLRAELLNPYSLCPQHPEIDVQQHPVYLPRHDPDLDAWVAPFVMAAINERIVHRSNALSGHAYSEHFRYDEGMLTGRGLAGRLAATAFTAGLAAGVVAGALPPVRAMLERFVLPAPGQGPSAQAQRRGHWELRFVGHTDHGRRIITRVAGERDPGYGSTARMLGEAGACLALDLADSPAPGDFWTPATLLGSRLVTRLQRHAGVRFEVLEPQGQPG
jgi:short subunit dehydrogenase-like uncharacterized protein